MVTKASATLCCHAIARRTQRRQQGRRRDVAGQRRVAGGVALLPRRWSVLVEQFERLRDNDRKPPRGGGGGEVAMPGRGRSIDRARGIDLVRAGGRIPADLEEVADADIMVDPAGVAQGGNAADQARWGHVVAVVVAGRDPQPVRRDDGIADRQRRRRPVAGEVGQRHGGVNGSRQWTVYAAIPVRHEGNDHPVDIPGEDHRTAGREAGGDRIEVEGDDGVSRGADGIVPQPDIPRAGGPAGVAPLEREGRAVDSIERHHPAFGLPAEAQRAAAIVTFGGVAEQRMIEAIDRLPDQSGKIIRPQEAEVDADRSRCRGRRRGHHRAREIDRPETRVEPLEPVASLLIGGGGEPVTHHPAARSSV